MERSDASGTERPAFGTLLRRTREAAGLTQRELAERAGISVKAVGTIERGERRRPQPHTVRRLTEALGLSGPARAVFIAAAEQQPASDSPNPPTIATATKTAAAPEALLPAPGRRLPIPITPLIGRRDEVAGIHALLEQARLVTLTGVGGTGKTRLAVQVATECQANFPDSIYFVNLAPLDDPDLVPLAIENALGAHGSTGLAPVDRIIGRLGDRPALLVLDNFEQVLEAATFISRLLQEAPGLRVLVTSRVLLHLYGEHEFRVAPLTLPDDRDGGPDTTRSEAVQLFLQAARAALSGFNPDPSGLEAIAEICRRLDGLPLAIELAAARCRYFTPEALLPRLANRLDVLSGTRRDLPARQQTLRQAFDWSYALLPANEQALFAQLGVFAGGFGPEIVERVCRPEGSDEWRGAPAELESLHESGLLEAGRTPDGEPRFEMLQTVREYAQARLAERGETEAVRRRHALGYLWLAEMANPRLTSPDQTRWLDRLEQSSDNFRLALQWAEDHQEPAVMLRLTSALWRYWNINLHLEEGHRWLSRSLAMAPEAAEDAPELVQARLESLFGLGRITLSQGKTSRAREELLEGLAAATRQDDPHWIGSMSTQLGHISFSLCEYDEARRYHERALELRRRLEESWPTGISLHSLGRVAFAVGDYEAARGYFEEAIGYLRESSTPPEIGRALAELARTYAALGDRERARALYDECRRLCQDAGEGASTQVLVWLAPAALALGEHDQALAFYQSILKVFNRIGHRRMVTICLEGIAVVLAAQDEQRAAARLLGAAGRLREEIDNLIQRPERLAIERAREQARSHLGEAAFHDAWEAGRALTLEQAIDEALKIPPPPTPSPELGRGDLSRSSCRLRS